MRSSLILGTFAALILAPTTWADKIYTSDGKVIEDVTVIQEALEKVTYKSGRNERKVDSQKVLSITFDGGPKVFGKVSEYLRDGDVEGAAQVYLDYAESIVSGDTRERRYKWAPANAVWRAVELLESKGDFKGAAAAASILVRDFPDSRYLPVAYLAKAKAEHRSGAGATAQATLTGFEALIAERFLSQRWSVECALALIETKDSLQGDKRRTALAEIADRAGSEYPSARNRAMVAIGESDLADLEAKRGDSAELLADALSYFEAVIADPLADEGTLAGAYAGRGVCLFQTGANPTDVVKLKQALFSFLRVAVVYPEQIRYMPQSLFLAGRCFELIGDENGAERAQRLYGQVWSRYPNSKWATEAKNFRRRR